MDHAADSPSVDIFDATLDGALGFELLEIRPDRVVGRMPVTDRVRQRRGLVHGGAYAALAELLASEATAANVDGGEDVLVVGASNHTSFLRPVTEGTVTGRGRSLHRGRTSWIWDVDFTDDGGRLCAVARVTIAVRRRSSLEPAR